jgi:hypothetical protein
MRAQRHTSPYEVLCYHCNVTFPVDAKRCVHCGGRLGARAEGSGRLLGMTTPFESLRPVGEAETLADEETPKRSSFLPAALLWALLFAGMSIHRACTSG